jgi:FAD/FMN-containing dehydrogenase
LFRTDVRARAAFSEGAGIHRIIPSAVARPADTADLQALVRWSLEEKTPLIPRGAGSSMAGAAVGDGVIVDLTAIAHLLVIDPDRRRATASSAITIAALNAAAAEHGLRMPVEPSSARWATAGGVVATNAAGARTLRLGSIRNWVEALDLVTADGEIDRLARGEQGRSSASRRFERLTGVLRSHAAEIDKAFPRVRKNSSGYALPAWLASGDALDVLVGSEGTLAVTTSVTWRLEPIPRARSAVRVALDDLTQLGRVVEALLALDPSAIELLDRTFLDLVRQHRGDAALSDLDPGCEAILLVEFEGDGPAEVAAQAQAAVDLVRPWSQQVSIALTPAEEERIWSLRHAASPILAGLSERRRSVQVIEDGCVPVSRLGRYIEFIRTEASSRGLQVVIFGHAGDGNIHVNLLPDLDRPDWTRQLESLFEAINGAVIELGGVVSGEHGVGRLRAGWMTRQYGATIVDLFRQIKAAFDPAGILNPGVVLPDQVPPIARLKFDPGAVAVPDDIVRALRSIEREGGYARSRLDIADQTTDPQPAAT